jgi:hypothetical protein
LFWVSYQNLSHSTGIDLRIVLFSHLPPSPSASSRYGAITCMKCMYKKLHFILKGNEHFFVTVTHEARLRMTECSFKNDWKDLSIEFHTSLERYFSVPQWILFSETKRRGRLVNASASYSEGLGLKSRPGDRLS